MRIKATALAMVFAKSAVATDLAPASCDTPKPSSDLTNCTFENRTLDGVTFDNSDLSYVSFRGARLSNVTFVGANLLKADFADADILRADFSAAALADTSFLRAKLNETTFRGSRLDNTYFRESVLRSSKFKAVTGTKSSFLGATVEATSFENTSIIEGDFAKVRLYRSLFADVNLFSGIFANCRIEDSTLERVDLRNAVLASCSFSATKILDSDLRQATLNGVSHHSLDLSGSLVNSNAKPIFASQTGAPSWVDLPAPASRLIPMLGILHEPLVPEAVVAVTTTSQPEIEIIKAPEIGDQCQTKRRVDKKQKYNGVKTLTDRRISSSFWPCQSDIEILFKVNPTRWPEEFRKYLRIQVVLHEFPERGVVDMGLLEDRTNSVAPRTWPVRHKGENIWIEMPNAPEDRTFALRLASSSGKEFGIYEIEIVADQNNMFETYVQYQAF